MYPVIHAVHVILQILLWLFYCFMNSFIYSFISLAHIIFFCCCLVCLKICTLKSLSTINIFLFTDMFMKQIITQISPAHNCTLQMFISCMSLQYATGTTEDVKPHNKYSAESNSGGRHKRATIGEKNTCYLYLRADPILWEHIRNRKYHTTLVCVNFVNSHYIISLLFTIFLLLSFLLNYTPCIHNGFIPISRISLIFMYLQYAGKNLILLTKAISLSFLIE